MSDTQDIELLIKSRTSIISLESIEENRVLDMFRGIAWRLAQPLYQWTVTDGLTRVDLDYPPASAKTEAQGVLKHIKSGQEHGIYILLDFHPYLDDPTNVRLLKDIAVNQQQANQITVVFLSHQIDLPEELIKFSAKVSLSLPSKDDIVQTIREVANEWSQQNKRKAVKTNSANLDILVNNLKGLTHKDVIRLARKAIFDDGAITLDDIPQVQKTKYELLSKDGVLSFEYDTAKFSDVGGFTKLKQWLQHRRGTFHSEPGTEQFDKPKGVLLLGVQGCGKSLAAKAIAGKLGVPLMRMDFGSLYNKYHGETERNLRESLKMSTSMSPCVLWIDEIEKGISTGDNDGGTSRRVLGTLLTWMAEKKEPVFLVATANDISSLPPELVRKGRFDEIFFVDLPSKAIRAKIYSIHLRSRNKDESKFDVNGLAERAKGFSGAEIEQTVVSALYSSYASKKPLNQNHILQEIDNTRPLSILMAEKIQELRSWAADRTVPCD